MVWSGFEKHIKKQMVNLLEIPSDIMLDLPKVVVVGNLQVFIENHRGIIEYTSELIRIIVEDGEINISGENLSIRNIMVDELIIEGKIKSLELRGG
ncbi:MAG: sporulation protein YqfC [Desulfotomaculum sp.]|nr:sporulation protein YqfC [Desulfotomaculum sp.]